MCKYCDNYMFENVGISYNGPVLLPIIYYKIRFNLIHPQDRIRFCPMCGREFAEKNYCSKLKFNSKHDF